MSVVDPYAPPTARHLDPDAARIGNSQLRIEGDCLVMPKETTLPRLCVRTGEPVAAGGERNQKFYWHSPWLYLLLLLNIIIFAIVAGINRKTAVITYSMSPAVRRERKRRLLISWGVFAGGVVLPFVAGAFDLPPVLILVGIVAALVGLFMAVLWCRVVWAQRIDATRIHLRGIPRDVMRAMVAVPTGELDWRASMFPPPRG